METIGVILTLKEMALRRVAIIMWSKSEILASFDEVGNENKVKDDMSKLGLPPILIEGLKNLIVPIQLEIKNWKFYHQEFFVTTYEYFHPQILEHLYWTVLGTIDYQKTAKNLIRLEILDLFNTLIFACIYCLDDSIAAIWKILPEQWKRPFDYCSLPTFHLWWPCILMEEEYKLDFFTKNDIVYLADFNKYAFENSASSGNIAATQYFFGKLREGERDALLLNTTKIALAHQEVNSLYDIIGRAPPLKVFPKEKHSETICYLLSQMTAEQQIQIYKKESSNILTCFLEWPSQHLFGDVEELLWPFFSEDDYMNILRNIIKKIELGYNLRLLFQEFFSRCPDAFKKYFVRGEDSPFSLLSAIFDLQDSEIIKVVFRNLDSEDRNRLLSYIHTFQLFYESVMIGNWHLVELCLKEARLSQEDNEVLKETYWTFLSESFFVNPDGNLRNDIWKQFLQFFDENQVKAPGPKDS